MSRDSWQQLLGQCLHHVAVSISPADHLVQGMSGVALNASAQGHNLNTKIFSQSVLPRHMSTFIMRISRAGIWRAGDREAEELNPKGDCRASAGESPQAWSNQMQLRPI